MVKTPKALEFQVTRVRPVETLAGGTAFVECNTSVGVIAFWGEGDPMINIEQIQAKRVPFRVRARCVQPDPPFDRRHSLWVPHHSPIEFL
jgi:hypothetical protein